MGPNIEMERRQMVIPETLLRRLDVPGPRYTSYPTADRFVEAKAPHVLGGCEREFAGLVDLIGDSEYVLVEFADVLGEVLVLRQDAVFPVNDKEDEVRFFDRMGGLRQNPATDFGPLVRIHPASINDIDAGATPNDRGVVPVAGGVGDVGDERARGFRQSVPERGLDRKSVV